MEKLQIIKTHSSSDYALYIGLSLIISLPLYFSLYFYIGSLGFYSAGIIKENQEKVAISLTLIFLVAVFLGRYLSLVHAAKNKKISKLLMIVLAIVVVVCLIVLGFIVKLSLRPNRVFLSILVCGLAFLILSLTSGMLLKLIHASIQNQLNEAKTLAINSQNELHLLQSQLSPHFLFNTLNNLYGISINQHEKVPSLLLRLSDLLRYSVYDAKELFVPLKDELNYINNYIEFEKIRIGERLELKTDIEEITNANIKIAPMLLIVFIENAFKHSKNTNDEKIFIEMSLKSAANSILFSIRNSYTKSKESNVPGIKNSGFGLDNVKKRLELLYPNEHDLKIENDEKGYSVMLRLKQK